MFMLPDAPDIALAMRSGCGFPRGPRCYCPECGGELVEGDMLYEWAESKTSEWLCADCFDERFDELTRDERAELIGSAYVTI